jgi:hypothetical protein
VACNVEWPPNAEEWNSAINLVLKAELLPTQISVPFLIIPRSVSPF